MKENYTNKLALPLRHESWSHTKVLLLLQNFIAIFRAQWIYCTTKMDNQQEEKIVLIVRLSADNTNANTDFNTSEPYINVLSDDTINRNIRSLNQEQG